MSLLPGMLISFCLVGFFIGRHQRRLNNHAYRITELETWMGKNGEPEK